MFFSWETKPGAILFGAPPCSSWVWISRGHSKRTLGNRLGDISRSDISSANRLVQNMVTAIYFAIERGLHVIIEQPLTSMMFNHPSFVKLQKVQTFHRVFLQLGKFKLPRTSDKPTVLMCTCLWAISLPLTWIIVRTSLMAPSQGGNADQAGARDEEEHISGWRRSLTRKISGDLALKNTAIYPTRFCTAVARTLQQTRG